MSAGPSAHFFRNRPRYDTLSQTPQSPYPTRPNVQTRTNEQDLYGPTTPLVQRNRPGGRGGSYMPSPDSEKMTMSVARGNVGGAYGPYSYEQTQSGRSTTASSQSQAPQRPQNHAHTLSGSLPAYFWSGKQEAEPDDSLHRPDIVDQPFEIWSLRGWVNVGTLVVILAGTIALFAAYPLIRFLLRHPIHTFGFGPGGINATGQVPDIPNMPNMMDKETPQEAMTYVGTDGITYNLIFSDEFNVPGRSFYPGDDPFWEAQDLYYWPTADYEWYDPQAITTTQDGKLVITLSEIFNHNLNFQSGMMTTWNKFCFTTGYVEVSVSLPGSGSVPGLWPGAWTMGNLGRPGYGASTDGTWPYTYDTCDTGTFPSQMDKNGNPVSSQTSGKGGTQLSNLPGQRLSACTCPGSDHPGPDVSFGRGTPEIDILEAQVNVTLFQGMVSQSFQVAPFNAGQDYNNTPPATTVYDDTITHLNAFQGNDLQQSLSALTLVDNTNYNNNSYATYGFEYWSDPNSREDGYITWIVNGKPVYTVTASSMGPDTESEVGQRLVSEEPMYLILNLGMAPSFQKQDFMHLQFPSQMFVDYIRVYQRPGVQHGNTCDPPNRPTSDYINRHINAYTNPNLTTWAMAGYDYPKNSLYDGC